MVKITPNDPYVSIHQSSPSDPLTESLQFPQITRQTDITEIEAIEDNQTTSRDISDNEPNVFNFRVKNQKSDLMFNPELLETTTQEKNTHNTLSLEDMFALDWPPEIQVLLNDPDRAEEILNFINNPENAGTMAHILESIQSEFQDLFVANPDTPVESGHNAIFGHVFAHSISDAFKVIGSGQFSHLLEELFAAIDAL